MSFQLKKKMVFFTLMFLTPYGVWKREFVITVPAASPGWLTNGENGMDNSLIITFSQKAGLFTDVLSKGKIVYLQIESEIL